MFTTQFWHGSDPPAWVRNHGSLLLVVMILTEQLRVNITDWEDAELFGDGDYQEQMHH